MCILAGVEIHGTVYKKGSWLVTGNKMYCGVLHPQFSQVKDIFTKGENGTPFLVMNETSLIEYLPNKRAYLVSLIPALFTLLLFYSMSQ